MKLVLTLRLWSMAISPSSHGGGRQRDSYSHSEAPSAWASVAGGRSFSSFQSDCSRRFSSWETLDTEQNDQHGSNMTTSGEILVRSPNGGWRRASDSIFYRTSSHHEGAASILRRTSDTSQNRNSSYMHLQAANYSRGHTSMMKQMPSDMTDQTLVTLDSSLSPLFARSTLSSRLTDQTLMSLPPPQLSHLTDAGSRSPPSPATLSDFHTLRLEPSLVQADAATHIQARFRGSQARKQVAEVRGQRNEQRMQEEAANTIQRILRRSWQQQQQRQHDQLQAIFFVQDRFRHILSREQDKSRPQLQQGSRRTPPAASSQNSVPQNMPAFARPHGSSQRSQQDNGRTAARNSLRSRGSIQGNKRHSRRARLSDQSPEHYWVGIQSNVKDQVSPRTCLKKRRDEASTSIQASWRGYSMRKKVEFRRHVSRELLERPPNGAGSCGPVQCGDCSLRGGNRQHVCGGNLRVLNGSGSSSGVNCRYPGHDASSSNGAGPIGGFGCRLWPPVGHVEAVAGLAEPRWDAGRLPFFGHSPAETGKPLQTPQAETAPYLQQQQQLQQRHALQPAGSTIQLPLVLANHHLPTAMALQS